MISRHLSRCVFFLIVLLFQGSTVWSQPALRYVRLPEPPGGTSVAHAVTATESLIVVGGSIMADTTLQACYWVGPVLGSHGSGWDMVPLPTPDITNFTDVLDVVTFVDDFGRHDFGFAGFWNGGTGGEPKPMFWTATNVAGAGKSVTTYAVLPTLGGASGFGGCLSVTRNRLSNEPWDIFCGGWSRTAAGVQRAVVWRADSIGDDWTLEPLPDFGAELESQVNAVVGSDGPLDTAITAGGCLDSAIVAAGWAVASGGAVLPQFWERDVFGVWTRHALPLPEGAVAGAVVSLQDSVLVFACPGFCGWTTSAGGVRSATFWATEDGMITWTVEVLGALPGHTHSESYDVLSIGVPDPSHSAIVGNSYNTFFDRLATLWMMNTVLETYDLNDIVVGPPPDLTLRAANGVFATVWQSIEYMYIVGWGEEQVFAMNSAAGPGDRHAWLLTDDLVRTAVDETPPSYDPALMVAYPNPFSTGTRVSYTLRHSASVNLSVHDVAGRRVATLVNMVQEGGEHTLTWDGRRANGNSLASGVYFVRLDTKGHVATRKIVLLR